MAALRTSGAEVTIGLSSDAISVMNISHAAASGMTVSSRTPEGEPLRCEVCGQPAAIEVSESVGDACCPSCGSLVWRVRARVAEALDVDTALLTLEARLPEIGADSLDLVELVMELEEEFDIDIPDDAARRITTIGDAVRYLHARNRRSK